MSICFQEFSCWKHDIVLYIFSNSEVMPFVYFMILKIPGPADLNMITNLRKGATKSGAWASHRQSQCE